MFKKSMAFMLAVLFIMGAFTLSAFAEQKLIPGTVIVDELPEPACYNHLYMKYLCRHYCACANEYMASCDGDIPSDVCQFCGEDIYNGSHFHIYFAYGYECPYCGAFMASINPYKFIKWGTCYNCGKQVFANDCCVTSDGAGGYNSAIYNDSFGDVKIYRFVDASLKSNEDAYSYINMSVYEYGNAVDYDINSLMETPTGWLVPKTEDGSLGAGLDACRTVEEANSGNTEDPNSNDDPAALNFWQKIVQFFKNIFDFFAGIFENIGLIFTA